jgi:hypothetical protein
MTEREMAYLSVEPFSTFDCHPKEHIPILFAPIRFCSQWMRRAARAGGGTEMDSLPRLGHWSIARDGHTVVTDMPTIGGDAKFDGGYVVAVGVDPAAAALIEQAPALAQTLSAAVGILHVAQIILASRGYFTTAHEMHRACENALDVLQAATGERCANGHAEHPRTYVDGRPS